MGYSDTYRRSLNKLGYYDYQQGLIVRHLKQQSGWEGHLEQCRRFILEEVTRISPQKITVLGSGWLLDFPLAELVGEIGKIDLIDIVHPPQVREQTARFSNVEVIEADLSGGLVASVWEKAGGRFFFNKLKSIDEISIPRYILIDPGMVISLNILTQLEVLPVRLLESKSDTRAGELTEFRRKIQNNHIDMLKQHRSLLISDVKEIFTYNDGTIEEEMTMLADMPMNLMEKRWQWDFDLIGQDFNTKKSVMEVVALSI